MAGGGAVVAGGNKIYPGKLTRSVIVACIIAAFGGLIFGYDIGISGGVTSMPPFLKKFFPSVYKKQSGEQSSNQYCKFDSHTLTLFTSSLYLAALVSCCFASVVTRKLGRKVSMMLGGLIFLLGAALNAGAENIYMLIFGRIALGIGVGFANQSVPVYLSEIAPSKYRGALNICFQFMITIGILIANFVNYATSKYLKGDASWRVSLGGAAVPALCIFIGSIFIQDSPNSLIERNQPDKAKTLLREIRGVDNVDEEFNDLVATCEASRKVVSPWKNLFSESKYRPSLVMATLIPLFQQITGINVIMFYAPVLFQTLGFGNNASLMSAVITGCVNVAATIVAIVAVDRWGRRILFLEGGVQMTIFQFIVGTLIWNKFGTTGVATIGSGYAAGVVICICIYVSGFAWSWGPLGWLVPSEIFPLEIRSAAQSITVSVNMLFTFLIAEIFLALLCKMKFGLFYMFVVFMIIMTIFIYFFVPETKGVPIEEMSRVWKQHWFWGKYIPDEDIIALDAKKVTELQERKTDIC